MNVEQFMTLLESRKGASIITITAVTEPDWLPLKATGPNPYKGKVWKRQVSNGMINWQYEAAVNRQREREGNEPDFEAMPRKWGTRIHGTPWVTHKGKTYLELKLQNVYSVEYIDANGNPYQPVYIPFGYHPKHDQITNFSGVELLAPIQDYLKPKSKNSRQQLDKEIILRDYTLTNIIEFTWGGISHQIAA
jgi:hypothetical protein